MNIGSLMRQRTSSCFAFSDFVQFARCFVIQEVMETLLSGRWWINSFDLLYEIPYTLKQYLSFRYRGYLLSNKKSNQVDKPETKCEI